MNAFLSSQLPGPRTCREGTSYLRDDEQTHNPVATLHNLVSDSANPHHVSDLLPQSFAGSWEHRTAVNLDSETLSQVPYDEQGTPAHVGLDQKKIKK